MLKRHILKIVGTPILALAVVALTNCCQAQERGLFSGAGIKTTARGDDTNRMRTFDFSALGSQEKRESPRFQFPKFEMPKWEKPKFQWPAFLQRSSYPKATQFSDKPSFLERMPKLSEMFPPRDPNEPTFFEKATERNRVFWSRTKEKFMDWSTNTNENIKARTSDSWNALTRGFTRDQVSSQPPAQPPLRSAQRGDGPRKRY